MARVLLVQPRFPVAKKSLNHKDFLPVGLLKLASWRKKGGDQVALSLGDLRTDFVPDEVYVTSLFTYWADFVREAVQHYRLHFPDARITVGGIYASLQPAHCLEFTGCDDIWRGVHPEAEECGPDYSLVEARFQIVHASRGCTRRCLYCGTHEIEPDFLPKKSVFKEIVKNHVVFYDNNLLANPNIASILEELAGARIGGRRLTCESQSGFDGRIILRNPPLAAMLKQARFRYPRIAWDGGIEDTESIDHQLRILRAAGFTPKDTQVFMLSNHELPPDVFRAKVGQCYQWGVQVADCRYRPLDGFRDGYNPFKKRQDDGEYYVHPGWADSDIRGLRRLVRANNICVRYGIPRERYAKPLERFSRRQKRDIAQRLGIDADRYTATELDRINGEWLLRQTTEDREQSQQSLPVADE